MDEKLLERWTEKKLITGKQRTRLAEDWKDYDQDRRGGKFVFTVAVIGALLLGIAAIVFISANWESIPSLAKIALMLAFTVVAALGGQWLRTKGYPKIGVSLVFLSTLLWGATVFVSVQTYQLTIPTHWLLLVWMLGAAGIAYPLQIVPGQVLSVALLFVWLFWVLLENEQVSIFSTALTFLPLLIFLIGSWHHKIPGGDSAGRLLRFLGIYATIAALLPVAFWDEFSFLFRQNEPLWAAFIGLACIAAAYLTKLSNPADAEHPGVETYPVMAVAAFAALISFIPAQALLLAVIAHALLIGIIILLFSTGYGREDMGLVNTAVLTLAVYVIIAYIDLFYELLQLSLFLFIGGVILLGGGFFLERKRRRIKEALER